MKKIKYLSAGILFIGAVLLSSCKKYDDGPGLSFRTKKARMSSEFEVTSFTINNENALNYSYGGTLSCANGGSFIYNSTSNTTRFIWTFEKNGDWNYEQTTSNQDIDFDLSYDLCNDYYDYTTSNYNLNGSWMFVSNNEKLEIKYNTGEIETWEIKELREKQVKLEMFDGTDIYKMTLKKR
jgi:hypothetical protein